MTIERREKDRRYCTYYLPLTDAVTTKQVGIMTDISLGGFKLECRESIPKGQVNQLHLTLINEIAPQDSIEIVGVCKWCQPDDIDPFSYNIGFEVLDMPPCDKNIFQLIFEEYGTPINSNQNNSDYLWK